MPSADQLEAVFDRLRPLMAAQAPRLVVLEDAPGAYVLGVQRVREDGYRVWFGAVKIGKRYVSYHLIPVYAHPDLLDESLFAELDTLTRRGLERFAADGLV
jgi:hypothetical protein